MTTPRLGAPELVSGQATPETTVNEQIRYIESGAGHFIFISRVVATPPGTPADGDCYLIAASPTGAWAGQAGKIAFRVNTAWAFITPIEGFTAWVNDENAFVGYDGAAWNVLASPSGTYVPLTYLDTDGGLAANSDTKIPSQKAVRTYVASKIVGMWDLRGATDCSANPNYPAAVKGDAYVVTVAGKIGGASGTSVNAGDVYFATADNAGGTQAAVGASWDTIVHTGVAAGGGLLAANNLSDVASAVAAKDNISKKGADIASAATTDLSTATGDFVNVTGTTTITALGTCAAGVERTVKFAGALTLTYNATSLILPTAANITTAAGDTAVFRSLGSGNWLCIGYQKANGQALSGSGGGGGTSAKAVPGGRLTLVSGTPVLTSDQTAKATVYYTPYVGTDIPIYDGAAWGNQTFAELTLTLDTTNHVSGSLYDVFVWNNAGTISVGTGPAWSSASARGTGAGTTELQRLNGLWTNKNSITLKNGAGAGTTGIAANTATYVGTIYCTANGQTGMALKPSSASGGTNNMLGVYNAYNRRVIRSMCRDNASSWSCTQALFIQSHASNSNRVSFIDGLGESSIDASFSVLAQPANTVARASVGIGLDITTGTPTACFYLVSTSGDGCLSVRDEFPPQLGFHFIQAMESSKSGGTAVSFFGVDGATSLIPYHHLIVSLEM